MVRRHLSDECRQGRHLGHASGADNRVTWCSDAYPYLNNLGQHCEQQAKVTPPEQVPQWLMKVHIMIVDLKSFLLGAFHWVSRL